MTVGNTPRKNIESPNQGRHPLIEAKPTGTVFEKVITGPR